MSKKFSPNFFIQSYYLFERWHTWVILRWSRFSACLAIMGKFLKYEVLQKPNFSREGTINCPWSLCRFMTSFWHVSDLDSVDLAPPCSESHSAYWPSDDLIEKFVIFSILVQRMCAKKNHITRWGIYQLKIIGISSWYFKEKALFRKIL